MLGFVARDLVRGNTLFERLVISFITVVYFSSDNLILKLPPREAREDCTNLLSFFVGVLGTGIEAFSELISSLVGVLS